MDHSCFENLIIYDVGLNTGQDTTYYLKKGFKVVAVEADPYLCEQAIATFRDEISDGRLRVLNVGVSDNVGSMNFYVNEHSREWSSFYSSIAGRAGHQLTEIQVPTDTLSNIINAHGVPYYLKIDIEGNDRVAVRSVLDNDYPIPYISIENGSVMLKDLAAKGYDRFKFIQQNNVHKLQQCMPALEGRYVDHQFEFGASGKFGEETEGEWLSYKEVFSHVSEVWDVDTGRKNPDWDDSVGGWFDLHARHKDYLTLKSQL
ncbi:FkbM family methyltransferase [Aestuariirhabdus sp. LZHN29]|uniref:FkbM family methyltransferase n=1 Tax=Aestuariirhabdus sp. LZHN29 TaxID=3417462 RepID=UPI003CEA8011